MFITAWFTAAKICKQPVPINRQMNTGDVTHTHTHTHTQWRIAAAAAAKSLQSCPTMGSVRPHRWKPTRLPHPWDSPGKNTGVGCHFLLQCMKVKVKVKSLSRVWLFETPWTAAYQAPPSMGFSRQEYWSGVPLPSPNGILLSHKK